MNFKRARTDAQIEERRKEILLACADLFDHGDVDDVHFKAIGEKTSFARSSIYKYYTTKEEILLDLLLSDILHWMDDIEAISKLEGPLSKEAFCRAYADTYINNERLLRLMSILHSGLEKNCSLEKLVTFKNEIAAYTSVVYTCVSKVFPKASSDNIMKFITMTSSYVMGLYPMVHLSEKQKKAIELSSYKNHVTDFAQSCYDGFYVMASLLD